MSVSKRSGQTIADVVGLLRCPVTQERLRVSESGLETERGTLLPEAAGQPVLVDFEQSILDRDTLLTQEADSLIGPRPQSRPWWKRLLMGQNRVSPQSAHQLLGLLQDVPDPVILIVGGGTVSDSARVLYDDDRLRIVAFDVYASAVTDFVADGHAIPLLDESVDAVWIEAVLEHVLSPGLVADEIWRVLKPDGLVYASTPFLQPVHEQAYDFTRFTESGHRWLFRRFSCIDSGVVAGPGTVLFQTLRYALGAVLGSRRWGSILAAPFFWVRFIDRVSDRRHGSDAASGVYFLGRRSEDTLRPRDMPGAYRGVSR